MTHARETTLDLAEPDAKHADALADALFAAAVAQCADRPVPPLPRAAPGDPSAAVAAAVLAERGAFAALQAVSSTWRKLASEAPIGPDRRRLERLVRSLDDAPRRAVFTHLSASRNEGPEREAAAMAVAERELGPRDSWARPFSRFVSQRLARVVLISTWQCELRCNYCWIPKQDGRVMQRGVIDHAIALLLSSHKKHVNMQFFGGEALLEYAHVQYAIQTSHRAATARGKTIDYVLSSNGWSLDRAKLEWLSDYRVKLELSLDGDEHTQATFRRSNIAGQDSYTASIAANADAIRASGLDHEVIMVVQPKTVARLFDNFFHVLDLGFDRVQINFALGMPWKRQYTQRFAEELFRIGTALRARWAEGRPGTMINLEHAPLPIRLNGEIHLDWDGTVYGNNGFLHESAHKARFVRGHVDDLANFDRYWLDAPTNDTLLEYTYADDVTQNNAQVGAVMTSFVRWMRQDEPSTNG